MTLRTKTLVALLTTTVLGFATTASAQDGWAGEASLAGSRTTGNTETTDLGLAFNIQKDGDVWRHTARGSADFGRVAGVNNKERFTLGYQLDRDITDRLYAFGNADWYQDDFGAFETGYYLGTGLGYKVILPAPTQWDVEAGLGFRSQETQGTVLVPSVTEDELALRGASKFKWDLNDNVSFYNNSEILYASSDTYLWNETGITATLMGNLAARASYRVDHHTDVPVGTEKTDTITRFGVVYTIN